MADLAGFAPGTLYNYFADLNTLLSYCVCKEYVLFMVENSVEVVLLLKGYFQESTESELIPRENLNKIENIIANYLHGILLFQIIGRAMETREEIEQHLEEHIKFLFNSLA